MILKKPVIIFTSEDCLLSLITIHVNCDLPVEVEDKIFLMYCSVISEKNDYRLSLLDAMKIKSAAIVQNIFDSPEEICYHLYDGLFAFPFTYISVEIGEVGFYELSRNLDANI